MKRYELEILTNSYTGNFERELAAYVFGYMFEHGRDVCADLCKAFVKEVGHEELFLDMFEHFYDEHGPTVCYLSSYKEGTGTMGITFKFEKDPSPYIRMIERRCLLFPKAWAKASKFSDATVKVKAILLRRLKSEVIAMAEGL
jgi:hypothetical protein